MSRHTLRAQDYLGHMLDAVRRMQQYAEGKNAETFLSDQLLQDGIARNFEIFGEAARKFLEVLPRASSRFPGIPFAAIYRMSDQLLHGDFAIDWGTVWKTIERDIPSLRAELERALDSIAQRPT
jgi:uncharacterized protein with HEPN domain